MFVRRRRRYEFVLKSFTTGSDSRSSSPTVRFRIEALYYGERFELVVADGTITYWFATGSDFRPSSPTVRFCNEVLYYAGRCSLVVTDGTVLY